MRLPVRISRSIQIYLKHSPKWKRGAFGEIQNENNYTAQYCLLTIDGVWIGNRIY
jgi:hypothetical protein